MSVDAEVVVIGAGPAGSTAALALHARGMKRAVVLDAATFPREKPCGGVIARRGVEALKALGVPLRVRHTPLRTADIRGGDREVRVHTGTDLGVVVRRIELDAALAAAVRARGIELREGVRVTEVCASDDGTRVVRSNAGEIRARCVIGADGATSVASKRVRAERGGPAPAYAAATEAFTCAGADDPARTCMRYDFSLGTSENGARTPGYAWDFPCLLADGATGFNRGVYSLTPRALPRTVPRQLEALLAARETIAVASPGSWPERLYDERRPLSAPGLFLAGEAIGVNPATGEGIAPAIESAVFAAHWIADGRPWEPYTHAFRRTTLGRRLSFGARLARLLYGPNGGFYRDLGIADARFQRLLMEDFAGDVDIPHWKRWLVARLALDVALQSVRQFF